jgi:predicted nuclease with TOPRIM domain
MATTRKISNNEDLRKAIDDLESKVKVQKLEIQDNYEQVKENLSPKRVVKNTFSYLAETPEIQRTLVNTVIGFILGYASKKAVELLSEDSLDRTIHNVVNHQLTKIENKEPDTLLSKGISLIRKHTPQDSPIYPFVRYK